MLNLLSTPIKIFASRILCPHIAFLYPEGRPGIQRCLLFKPSFKELLLTVVNEDLLSDLNTKNHTASQSLLSSTRDTLPPSLPVPPPALTTSSQRLYISSVFCVVSCW
ncbi:UNVERIFIED_CONTAM: hypothetical protein FKN15_038407 [Acipenser sinensis]